MIYMITQESAHLCGDAIPSMYRLRYRAFIQRQSYDVHSIRQMEYDSYDTPAATYLVWKDIAGVVRGCVRLSSTTRPYMIKDLWPDLITDRDLPCQSSIWEASRFCIEKELPSAIRKQIHGELIYALQELGLRLGMHSMIGVMQPQIWKYVFINMGWPIEFMGHPKQIVTKEEIIAGCMPISSEILEGLQVRLGMPSTIICNFKENLLREAA